MATMTAPPGVPKQRFNYEGLQQSIAVYPGAWLLVTVFVGGFFYLMYRSHWNAAVFQNINPSNVLGFLTPLIVVSAVIERAIEVVISPWRDKDGDQKVNAVQAVSTLVAAAPDSVAAVSTLQDATDDLAQYTGQTRRYAFALAVGLSAMAVTSGVRVLWPMLDANVLKTLPTDQQDYLRWFDMLLSTLLLAGGAAGIHAPITAITSFFQKSS